MKIAAAREEREGEKRAALSPDTAKRYKALGFSVAAEKNLGAPLGWGDEAYAEAGAELCPDAAKTIADADILLAVRAPSEKRLRLMRKNALLIGLLDPFGGAKTIKLCASAGITSFALELLPRISRAQSMDALSSQSNLAGYRAVIEAAHLSPRAMPMMMTAAGTVAPSRLFVMGAGVAGLQAIATARRLGAIVSATDIRAQAKEQVESLGADFVMVEAEEEGGETAGGYAREASEDYQKRQAALVSEHLKSQDIVICTALVPGKPAPQLISAQMVKAMRLGAIIVDLAIEQGGNCALSQAGKIVNEEGVFIIAHRDVPSLIAADASALYARNLFHFVENIVNKEKKALAIDWQDELVRAAALTREGEILNKET